jgi:hypothetical protein
MRTANQTGHRLGDCITVIMAPARHGFCVGTAPGEFCVVDKQKNEKAFCEWPNGATSDTITAMIESHFDARALQVAETMWIV